MTTQNAIPMDERWKMDDESPQADFLSPNLYTVVCTEGRKIFLSYCQNWLAAYQAHRDFPEGHRWLVLLDRDRDLALDAHREHAETCEKCRGSFS